MRVDCPTGVRITIEPIQTDVSWLDYATDPEIERYLQAVKVEIDLLGVCLQRRRDARQQPKDPVEGTM